MQDHSGTELDIMTPPATIASGVTGTASQRTQTTSIGPGHKNFGEKILNAYGVEFKKSTRDTEVLVHFQTKPPEGLYKDVTYWNPKLKRDMKLDTTVWLELNDEQIRTIIGEYTDMIAKKEVEAKFASWDKERLLLRENRFREVFDEKKYSRVDRMVEVPLTPGDKLPEALWSCPSLVKSNAPA